MDPMPVNRPPFLSSKLSRCTVTLLFAATGPMWWMLGLQEEVSLSWDARQLPAPDAHPSLCAEMVGGDGEEAQDALLAQFDSLCHFFPSAAEVGWGHYTAGLSSYT